MHQKEAAIIVAGGKGLRLPGDIPKQFIEISGLPVLMHTINAFRDYSQTLEISLVLPVDHFGQWENLCRKYHFIQKIAIVPGGSNRFQSVMNGLESISGPGIVAVHDGVRPLVTPDIIAVSFGVARQHRSAVASVPLKESIRELRGTGPSGVLAAEVSSELSVAVDRTKFRVMQTPQTFDIGLLKSAYRDAEGEEFTDDASVVEQTGHNIALFEGSYENLKITTPVDLVVAEAIIQSRKHKASKS
jgi:2-C-methyl-D-erythritol 4-phosphate cytidylyltransferase